MFGFIQHIFSQLRNLRNNKKGNNIRADSIFFNCIRVRKKEDLINFNVNDSFSIIIDKEIRTHILSGEVIMFIFCHDDKDIFLNYQNQSIIDVKYY